MTTTQTERRGSEPRTLALDHYSEQTRRDLYDLVVKMQFSAIEGAGPDDYPGPSYTAEEAKLEVFYLCSRWFATWLNLDEKNLPEELRIELVRLEADSSAPFGMIMHEV
ncbi:MAG TPA: hypothetical protein VH988_01960 [Thermoanaerobaculia bacterium]|jgi:hypothetical protein|nr:hypothetical protein [Thermoanaerobaculia bacterium]